MASILAIIASILALRSCLRMSKEMSPRAALQWSMCRMSTFPRRCQFHAGLSKFPLGSHAKLNPVPPLRRSSNAPPTQMEPFNTFPSHPPLGCPGAPGGARGSPEGTFCAPRADPGISRIQASERAQKSPKAALRWQASQKCQKGRSGLRPRTGRLLDGLGMGTPLYAQEKGGIRLRIHGWGGACGHKAAATAMQGTRF